jgi:hypothetical protein
MLTDFTHNKFKLTAGERTHIAMSKTLVIGVREYAKLMNLFVAEATDHIVRVGL